MYNTLYCLYCIMLASLLCHVIPYQVQTQTTLPMPTSSAQQPIRILCIDGGGVRGIIPARILQEFEEKTSKPIHELFDIIVGTSTGGILGLALTMPNPEQPDKAMYTAKECVGFYLAQSSRIFQKSTWRTLSSGFGIWGAKYDRRHLDEVLGEFFQDSRLAQALCPVGVLSYSLEKHAPRLWSSYVAQQTPRKNQYMRDAAAVTSAAPTYFLPKTITSAQGKETLSEVDGGIYANNPAIASLIALAKLYPNFLRKDLVMVSLGTGKRGDKHEYGFSGIRGISRLISAMIDATGVFVDEALEAILPNNYYDLEVTLRKALMPMDNGNKQHLQALIKHAEQQLLEDKKAEIDELLKKLTSK